MCRFTRIFKFIQKPMFYVSVTNQPTDWRTQEKRFNVKVNTIDLMCACLARLEFLWTEVFQVLRLPEKKFSRPKHRQREVQVNAIGQNTQNQFVHDWFKTFKNFSQSGLGLGETGVWCKAKPKNVVHKKQDVFQSYLKTSYLLQRSCLCMRWKKHPLSSKIWFSALSNNKKQHKSDPIMWEMGQNIVKVSQIIRKWPCFSMIESALLRNSRISAGNFVNFSLFCPVFRDE